MKDCFMDCVFPGIEWRAFTSLAAIVIDRVPRFEQLRRMLELVTRDAKIDDEQDCVTVNLSHTQLTLMLGFAQIAEGFNTVHTAEVFDNPGHGSTYVIDSLCSAVEAVKETIQRYHDSAATS
jgi:hypothetical protein